MSDKLKVTGIDLTAIGDVPLPSDRTHPVFDYPEPLASPSTDIPYPMLVMMVHALQSRIEVLEQCVSNLTNNAQLEGIADGKRHGAIYRNSY